MLYVEHGPVAIQRLSDHVAQTPTPFRFVIGSAYSIGAGEGNERVRMLFQDVRDRAQDRAEVVLSRAMTNQLTISNHITIVVAWMRGYSGTQPNGAPRASCAPP